MNLLLINYDNGSRWPVMPQNLYQLKACVEAAGHKCEVLDFNLHRVPYTELYGYRPDVLGLGFISGYWPHREALKIGKIMERHPWRDELKFIIGGHAPSAAPEYYMKKLRADSVFTGSADISLVDWLDSGMPDGIHESKGFDIDIMPAVPGPGMMVYKRIKFPNTLDHEFAIQILSGRGCPYHCAFCHRPDAGCAPYSIEMIRKQITYYANTQDITHFQFSDELLTLGKSRVSDICDMLLDVQYDIGRSLYFDCNARLKFAADNPDMLDRMKEAGFRYLNFGCESLRQKALDAMDKKQKVEDIHLGVIKALRAGLHPGLNFMWGCPEDNEKSLYAAEDFINKYSTGAELRTIRPMTPFPGTKFFDQLVAAERIKDIDDFYIHHSNSDLFSYHFMRFENDEANYKLYLSNRRLMLKHWHKTFKKADKEAGAFYQGGNNDFRGFREV